jgi:uncharacterized protein YgbK (DUF1537 family)
MIAVLADDFTGAAELCGIALRYHLKVELNAHAERQAKPDLLVIYTNARSQSENEAKEIIKNRLEELMALQPAWIFKKLDSVLRGHVAAELAVQLQTEKKKAVLLAPANPSLGRTLVDGQYWIKGKPIHQTGFSTDPEFPIHSSDVRKMIGHSSIDISIINKNQPIPDSGMVVVEVEEESDLDFWAAKLSTEWVPAGGSGFFSAMLRWDFGNELSGPSSENVQWGSPLLVVSGTSFEKNVQRLAKLAGAGAPVIYLQPIELANAEERRMKAWVDESIHHFQQKGNCTLAFQPNSDKIAPQQLASKMAELVKMIYDRVKLKEMIIEGGATSFAIISRLGLQQFFPTEELMPGVVRMRVGKKEDLHITFKPGSYDWPPSLQSQIM